MRQLKITPSFTSRESSLGKYLSDVSKYSIAPLDDEVTWAQEAKKGNRKALEALTCANLCFVISVAKQYQNQGLSLPDLINEGNIGLMKAVKNFDETRGFKFISYAVWYIRQSILQALAENGEHIRLSWYEAGRRKKVRDAFDNFVQGYEREPLPEELVEDTIYTVEQVKDALLPLKPMRLDAPVSEGSMISFSETIPDYEPLPDEGVDNPDLSARVNAVLEDLVKSGKLNDTECEVVKMFFGIGYPIGMEFGVIGGELGVGRQRARAILKEALSKLRRSKAFEQFRGFL